MRWDPAGLQSAIKVVNSDTLPEAASLVNGAVANAAVLIAGIVSGAEACAGDAITQIGTQRMLLVQDLNGVLDRLSGARLMVCEGGFRLDIPPKKEGIPE